MVLVFTAEVISPSHDDDLSFMSPFLDLKYEETCDRGSIQSFGATVTDLHIFPSSFM